MREQSEVDARRSELDRSIAQLSTLTVGERVQLAAQVDRLVTAVRVEGESVEPVRTLMLVVFVVGIVLGAVITLGAQVLMLWVPS